jgi:hypothetical protein
VQALELYAPVHRFNLLIRRRKGERQVRLDWHALVKAAEPLLCEAGSGLDRVRDAAGSFRSAPALFRETCRRGPNTAMPIARPAASKTDRLRHSGASVDQARSERRFPLHGRRFAVLKLERPDV